MNKAERDEARRQRLCTYCGKRKPKPDRRRCEPCTISTAACVRTYQDRHRERVRERSRKAMADRKRRALKRGRRRKVTYRDVVGEPSSQRELSKELAHDARDVSCTACGSEPGYHCVATGGLSVPVSPHRTRLLEYITSLQQQLLILRGLKL